MSYDISLYRIETKEKEQQSNEDNFFENEENLIPFTKNQYDYLKERLMTYNYELGNLDEYGLHFRHADVIHGIALLTKRI